MEIRPILATILRNPVGLILIGLQVALTLAIVVNALYIITTRLDNMRASAGIDEDNLLTISSTAFSGDESDTLANTRQDLDYLRGLPGVVDAMAVNTLPMAQSGWSTEIEASEDPDSHAVPTAIYFADHSLVNSLGLELIAGRPFREAEIKPYTMDQTLKPDVSIISAALALALFPDIDNPAQALGRHSWNGDENDRFATEIVGIVDGIKAPWKGFSVDIFNNVVFVPFIPLYGKTGSYAVRAEPGQLDRLLGSLQQELTELNPQRVVRDPRTFSEFRERFFRGDKSMAVMLSVVVGLLLLVNVLGIVGLVSFWVTQRTKQIGTRRALGATRGNILQYFLVENALISSAGVLLGAVLAMALNNWLASEFQVQRLPWHYLAGGSLALLLTGLAATCVPALRAAAIPPAIATRSV
ncbi:FtsX-like permease family protein [Parahaliea mediterranea]|uniref:FtsX-like permease family protein n=1 Tax=Parahaliea mediterranea TaxID=651086 RepID=A0A939DE82_9GAMM|nr:FtsX-like permease family protein [Parahaliea mediterranea]MBN7796489.1 FtsX-like permease family protein [Parahaliea mediterranea]